MTNLSHVVTACQCGRPLSCAAIPVPIAKPKLIMPFGKSSGKKGKAKAKAKKADRDKDFTSEPEVCLQRRQMGVI
jgi:hypothetical protein